MGQIRVQEVLLSRTFLYQNTDAKKLVAVAIEATSDQRPEAPGPGNPRREHRSVMAQRALNAEDAIKAAYAEIDTQRERIGLLLGQLRELQAEYTEGTAQRLAEETAELKQRRSRPRS